MIEQPYLIFTLSQAKYGIEAAVVQELFFLPKITPIPEAPVGIMGVINLRNEVLPIIDLHQWLGRRSPVYKLSDSIIVVQTEQQRVGILVNQVCEVQPIDLSQVDRITTHWEQRGQSDRQLESHTFRPSPILGIAKLGEVIVTLLDPVGLTQSVAQTSTAWREDGSPSSSLPVCDRSHDADQAFAHFSIEAQAVLQQRAESLRQSVETQESAGLLPLAVVGLDGEYFGLGLESVHEFADISSITPIPCCPSHIVGNMNLRGEIITLVDIRRLINLSSQRGAKGRKAIIVRQEQLVAGITVDEIFDVTYVHPSQLSAAPVAVHSVSDEYLQGVASYQEKMMSVINLPKVLHSGALVVNEEVS